MSNLNRFSDIDNALCPVLTSKISLTNFLARVDNEHIFFDQFFLNEFYESALFEYANNLIIMVSTSCKTHKTDSAKVCVITKISPNPNHEPNSSFKYLYHDYYMFLTRSSYYDFCSNHIEGKITQI
jgi:hypothetical protein